MDYHLQARAAAAKRREAAGTTVTAAITFDRAADPPPAAAVAIGSVGGEPSTSCSLPIETSGNGKGRVIEVGFAHLRPPSLEPPQRMTAATRTLAATGVPVRVGFGASDERSYVAPPSLSSDSDNDSERLCEVSSSDICGQRSIYVNYSAASSISARMTAAAAGTREGAGARLTPNKKSDANPSLPLPELIASTLVGPDKLKLEANGGDDGDDFSEGKSRFLHLDSPLGSGTVRSKHRRAAAVKAAEVAVRNEAMVKKLMVVFHFFIYIF
jgi:hypothetical protein